MRGRRRCVKCGHETIYTGNADQTYRMNPERFKKTFKVGDIVTAWSTDKKVKITGIGETRVMFIDEYSVKPKELIASMNLPWRKME